MSATPDLAMTGTVVAIPGPEWRKPSAPEEARVRIPEPRRATLVHDATSAAIALVLEDHDAQAATVAAVRGRRLGLAGHAWFATYSVLTRLPGDLRRSPADAARILTHNFPASALLSASVTAGLGADFARLGIGGGAVYDALVGAAARHSGQPLLTRDARAWPTYAALGVTLAAAAVDSCVSKEVMRGGRHLRARP